MNSLHLLTSMTGVSGGVVGWGTALQAVRSRVRILIVSLELERRYYEVIEGMYNKINYIRQHYIFIYT